MSNIRKVNDKTVIDILKDLTDQIVASGEADERDSDALYHLGLDIMNWKNIKRNWKTRFAEISEYIHDIDDKTAQTLYDAEAENLETLKLSDDIWEFNAFSDSYEGCRVSLTSDGDKLKLVSWEVIDEEECEVEGISDSKIYKLLN